MKKPFVFFCYFDINFFFSKLDKFLFQLLILAFFSSSLNLNSISIFRHLCRISYVSFLDINLKLAEKLSDFHIIVFSSFLFLSF